MIISIHFKIILDIGLKQTDALEIFEQSWMLLVSAAKKATNHEVHEKLFMIYMIYIMKQKCPALH